MSVNIQTDTGLVNNYADNQNAFNTAYDTTTKRLDAVQTGREKATVNKLYGEALNADGTLDTNKLTQGMASTGLGANIPELLQQKQEQELNTLKLGKAKVDQSLSHLGIIGQVMGGVTTVEEYNKGLNILKSQGVNVDNYPKVTTDEEAKKNASFAASNAVSAGDKLDNEYKNSEVNSRLMKYELDAKKDAKEQEWKEKTFTTTSGETARHNRATEQYQQEQNRIKAENEGKPNESQQYNMETKYDTAEKERKVKLVEIEKDLGDLEANNKETKDLLGSGVLSGKTYIEPGLFGNLVADAGNAGYLPFLPDTELGKFRIALGKKIKSAKLAVMAGQKGAQTKEDAQAIEDSITGINAVRSPKELTTLLITIDNAEQRINKQLNAQKSIFSAETPKPNFMSENPGSSNTTSQPAKPSLSAIQAKYPPDITPDEKKHLDDVYMSKGYK